MSPYFTIAWLDLSNHNIHQINKAVQLNLNVIAALVVDSGLYYTDHGCPFVDNLILIVLMEPSGSHDNTVECSTSKRLE